MPYRRGLERGDIPRGGFLGSAFSAITHTVGGAIGGFIKGGPIGGIIGAATGAAISTKKQIDAQGGMSGGAMPIGSIAPPVPSQTPEALGDLHRAHVAQGQRASVNRQIAAPPGGGGMRMIGSGRRRRRMQVTNTRALRRAIRRTSGFAKLAMKTIHIIHPKKRGTFGGFKKKRRAS